MANQYTNTIILTSKNNGNTTFSLKCAYAYAWKNNILHFWLYPILKKNVGKEYATTGTFSWYYYIKDSNYKTPKKNYNSEYASIANSEIGFYKGEREIQIPFDKLPMVDNNNQHTLNLFCEVFFPSVTTWYQQYKSISISTQIKIDSLSNKIIKYYDINNNILEQQSFKINSEIVIRENAPNISGKAFAGWGLDSSRKNVNYNPGAKIILKEDLNLYAIYDDAYTITFNSNNKQNQSYILIKRHNVDLSMPENFFNNPGYSFQYWTSIPEDLSQQDFAEVNSFFPKDIYRYNENRIFYAQWEPVNYTITFNLNGGQGTVPEPIKKIHGEDIFIPPEPKISKKNCVFIGWGLKKEDNDYIYYSDSIFNLNNNYILYAIWININGAEVIDYEELPSVLTFYCSPLTQLQKIIKNVPQNMKYEIIDKNNFHYEINADQLNRILKIYHIGGTHSTQSDVGKTIKIGEKNIILKDPGESFPISFFSTVKKAKQDSPIFTIIYNNWEYFNIPNKILQAAGFTFNGWQEYKIKRENQNNIITKTDNKILFLPGEEYSQTKNDSYCYIADWSFQGIFIQKNNKWGYSIPYILNENFEWIEIKPLLYKKFFWKSIGEE